MERLFPLGILFLLLQPVRGTEYFVAPGGNNGSSGLDSQTAFQTIQHAFDVTKPGDTVTVLDGVYHESVHLYHSGAKDQPITIRSRSHWGAKVIGNGNPQDCFTIGGPDAIGVCYITIEDFDLSAPQTYGCGVYSSNQAHHITVDKVYAHDCGSSGIQLNDGDYRIARENVCARNAWLMPYCGSGISFYGLIKADDAPGFHTVISGNVCYANDNGPTTKTTDGNGIIVDDFRDGQVYHTTKPPPQIHYTGADTLVEGNLTFHNGGKGIQIYMSNHVKVINNTSADNMTRGNQLTDCGEIAASCSDDVLVANNIAITATRPVPAGYLGKPNGSYLILSNPGQEYGANVTFFHNLAQDVNNPSATPINATGLQADFLSSGGNLPNTDPRLLNAKAPELSDRNLSPTTDFASYFGLATGSPALGAGSQVAGSSIAQGSAIDLGAFQQHQAP